MTENFHDAFKITASSGSAIGFRAFVKIGADRAGKAPAIFPLSGSGATLILPLPLTPEQFRRAAKRGVLAQLVERLNGIEEVRGSNPLGSTSSLWMAVAWTKKSRRHAGGIHAAQASMYRDSSRTATKEFNRTNKYCVIELAGASVRRTLDGGG
jgi:hypothetical protein